LSLKGEAPYNIMPGRTTSKSDSGSDKIAAEFAIERLFLFG
jgi:hypothetical protein